MRVLFLRPQPAIRSLKYALAFINLKLDVELYHGYTAKTITQLYGYGDECFKKFLRLDPRRLSKSLKSLVQRLSIDLIHSQNAPDILTRIAVESIEKIPIIHENQDVISLRETPYTPESSLESQLEDEKIANERCDARIHVSHGISDYIRGRFGEKRELVFHNYSSSSLMPCFFKKRLSEVVGGVHIVYEGTLSSLSGDHYDLRDIFTDLARRGYHIHIYDSHSNQDYARLAGAHRLIHYHGHYDPRRLLFEMTKYDYGWAGFNVDRNRKHVDVALPNKLFEYLASGLPVLSFPHKAQKEFIEANQVGIILEGLDELDARVREHTRLEEIRRNVMLKRFDFTVETRIRPVIALYHSLLVN